MVTLVNQTKNKIYYMQQPDQSQDTFQVRFGRVGGMEITKTFPTECWDEIYKEKITNGYVDQSKLFNSEEKIEKVEKKPFDDPELLRVLTYLRNCSRQIVNDNFLCVEPTKAMLERAEGILAELSYETDLWKFNDLLMELFTLIPRRMKNIIINTAKSPEDFSSIIERETSLIDNLSVYDKSDSLKADGIHYEKCSAKDWEEIKKLYYGQGHHIKNAWRVTSDDQERRFKDYLSRNHVSDTRLVFHGSRSENWWSIILKALAIRPSNAISQGSMFGLGLYFALDAVKSLGYTSLSGSLHVGGTSSSGFLGVYEIAYNNPWDIYSWGPDYTHLNESSVLKKGYGCVHAHKGRDLYFDEIIVYNRDACHMKYLLEIN